MFSPQTIAAVISLALMFLACGGVMGTTYALQDFKFPDITRALPASATTVYSTAIDLESVLGSNREKLFEAELEIVLPTLNSTLLPDTQTVSVGLVTKDADGTLSSGATVLIERIKTLTGASSSGATGATIKLKIPTDAKRYIGISLTNTGAADRSSASATLKIKF